MKIDFNLAFGDGACSGNPGPGAWAALFVDTRGEVVESGVFFELTTNNRMELSALVWILQQIQRNPLPTKIALDSKYVLEGAQKWLANWKRRQWKTSQREDVANQDIWKEIDSLLMSIQVPLEWIYVPGHAGIAGNERCDQLAVELTQTQKTSFYKGPLDHYSLSWADLNVIEATSKNIVYLAWLPGKNIQRFNNWAECEIYVRGKPGAKYKKIKSISEEKACLSDWGYRGPLS